MNAPKDFAATIAEMKRLSEELHGGKYAPSASEFEQYRTGDAAGRSTIFNAYGEWPNFAAACGLQVADKGYYMMAGKARGGTVHAERKAEGENAERRMDAVARKMSHMPNARRQVEDETHMRDGITVFDEPRLDVAYVPGVGMVERLAWQVR